MISAVLFDLDGTLLPVDQEAFTRAYFSLLAEKLAPRGYPPERLVPAVWAGVKAMVENDGLRTNDALFWDSFCKAFGPHVYGDIPAFEQFYCNEFHGAKRVCGYNEAAARTVARIKAAKKKLILASNPVFPLVAQKARMGWAGVDPADFCYLTSYENSHYCKPNPAYYGEIASVCGLDPAQTLMVGNDVREDGAARACGMKVFILTDCLIDPAGRAKDFPHGGYDALGAYLDEVL